MEKVLNMTFASTLTGFCELNSSFDCGILRVAYAGENRNGSFISREAFEDAIPTMFNCPVVCHYDRETDTLGGHDIELVRNGDGDLKIVNLTVPVGCIPESARYWWDTVTEDDGSEHEYLYVEVLLWKRQEAYQKIKRDGITAHSMEIGVKDGKTVDGLYHINKFEFTAFTLIGVEPCFESSALEVFSNKAIKDQIAEMMNELKESFNMINTPSGVDDTHPQNNYTEGGEKRLEDKTALAQQYGIDVEGLDFNLDDFSIEELTAKFEEMKAAAESESGSEPETAGEPEKEPEAAPEADNFALTGNIVEELQRVLDEEKIQRDWGECHRYWYVDCDIELGEVYCWDLLDWLLYGFKFSMNGDAVIIDFESKKRKKYIIADFDEGDQPMPGSEVFSMIESALADVTAKYNEASDALGSAQDELNELREYKAGVENAAAKEARENILNQFEDLFESEAFIELRNHCMEYDTETLEEKCYAIRGRAGAAAKFSAEVKAPKLKVSKTDISDEPYGGLFLEYGNKTM